MPFTFFAHQAPVLPLSERHPERWDGVALVVGSMGPDLAFVTSRWGYGPAGIPLWFDGHRAQNLFVVALGSCIVAWLVRHVVLRVLPLVVPDGGALHLHDYRFIAERRHRWWVVYWSAVVGVVTHLVLDAFTHEDGWVVQRIGALRAGLFPLAGHELRVYGALQLGGTAVLSVVAARALVRIGRERHFVPSGEDDPVPILTARATGCFWAVVGLGCVLGVVYAVERSRTAGGLVTGDTSTVVISFCWVAFLGLVAASAGVRRFVHQPLSTHS